MGRKMAKALEDADKRKVDYAVIVGERMKEGGVMLRNLAKRDKLSFQSRVWLKKSAPSFMGYHGPFFLQAYPCESTERQTSE